MTRVQFLNELYRRLGGMSQEEAEQHLTYYAEMLADRMEEGMTEDEAVASMEDVDTIARRILQDRAAERGESAEGAAPPRYPDPPARPAAEGKDAFADKGEAEEPKKRRRSRWAIPALVAAVLLAFIFLVPGPQGYRGVVINDEGAYLGGLLSLSDDGVLLGRSLYIGDEGIRFGSSAVAAMKGKHTDTTPVETPTDYGVTVVEDVVITDTPSGELYNYVVSAQGISRIKVDWISGQVAVEVTDGEDIQITESSTVALSDENCLYCTVENGELTIHFSKKNLQNFRGTKNVIVAVPRSLVDTLAELEVDTTSADVTVTGVDAGKLELDTTSGNCQVLGNYGSVSVDTTSGSAVLVGDIREVEFDSVSGELRVQENAALVSLEADTTSGDVFLNLPSGFTLRFDTVSGTFDSGSAFVTLYGDAYTYGDGSTRLEVSTVNGSLYLQ